MSLNVAENSFFAGWGFYSIKDLPKKRDNFYLIKEDGRSINVLNGFLAIPVVGNIMGIALTIFAYKELKDPVSDRPQDKISKGLIVKGILSTFCLGIVLVFVDLGIFFKRLHDAK